MTTRLLLALFVAVPVTMWACATNKNPHDDEASSFPLIGKHAAIECESCHGSGQFTALTTACEGCHEDDRPEGHYAGSCGEAGCHIPAGWLETGGLIGDDDDDDDTTIVGDDDDDTPTGDDDDTTTPTGDDDDDTTTPTGDDDDETTPTTPFYHDFLPLEGPHNVGCTDCHVDLVNPTERLVCLDCHEDDRDGADHYAGQDCAHCHPVEAGWGNNQVHEFQLAHPKPGPLAPVNGCVSIPAPVPVELCISCHPDPTDRAGSFDCVTCHEKTETDCRHANGLFPGYIYANPNCLACHPEGD
jgi:hypothetical protein